MLRHTAAAVLSLALAMPVFAQSAARVDPVLDALAMPELLTIMREEGLGYGARLEADMFPGKGRAGWSQTLEGIYSVERMEAAIRAGMDTELAGTDLAPILDFFGSEQGVRIVELELAARRAMLDEAVEEAATVAWRELESTGSPRWSLLTEFAAVNDLIESNVAGALTSNYAFYTGLIDGRALGPGMTEEEVLGDVWSQEPSIREDTVNWVYSFTALAYQPLSDGELQAYLDFMATDEGRALNAALFSAFNALFADISRDLGLGAARYLAGQDI